VVIKSNLVFPYLLTTSRHTPCLLVEPANKFHISIQIFFSEFNNLTSFINSHATAFCFNIGCDKGDSNKGSIGSSGLIRCAKIHNLGSDTSRTLNGPFWPLSVDLSICGDGSLRLKIKLKFH
jgi:hypothetical protein